MSKRSNSSNSSKNNELHDGSYKLQILFNIVVEKSYSGRKANPNKFDGLGFWQPIKKLLEPLDKICMAKKWKPLSKKITDNILRLPEYYINGYEEKIINEKNHFIIQQVRIPLKEDPTIKKIIQIALNIGQYKGIVNDSHNNRNNNINYETLNLDTLDKYITAKDIEELSKYITDEKLQEIIDYLKTK